MDELTLGTKSFLTDESTRFGASEKSEVKVIIVP